jgi:hypothetical protein
VNENLKFGCEMATVRLNIPSIASCAHEPSCVLDYDVSPLVSLVPRFVYLSLRISICSYLLGYNESFIYEIDFSSPQLVLSLLRISFSLRYARIEHCEDDES